jgi:EpsI family protein
MAPAPDQHPNPDRGFPMNLTKTAIVLASLMCAASVASIAARPSATAVQKGQGIVLETMVPKQFGEWREVTEPAAQVVNPQTRQLLDKLYSQLLSRTYVNKAGYRIMLSMAYGDDQRGSLEAHKPEVCYPAQWFKLLANEAGRLATGFGDIEVRRLSTSLGQRNEPVTYWFTVGDQVAHGALQKRIAEIRLGLTGQIPDGLLFRISSIDPDAARGFTMQQAFAADLLAHVQPNARKRLSGLGAS